MYNYFKHYWIWQLVLDGVVDMDVDYLTIIPRGRVGYEMIDSQRGA